MLHSSFKRSISAIATLICSIYGYAQGEYTADFELNGIYYKFNSLSEKTVSVCNKSISYIYDEIFPGTIKEIIPGNVYSGMVNIPEYIDYNGTTYMVNGIEPLTFYDTQPENDLSILIPKTVKKIEMNRKGESCFSRSVIKKIAYPISLSSVEITLTGRTLSDIGGIAYPDDAIIDNGYIYSADLSSLLFVSTDVEGELIIPSEVSIIGNNAVSYCSKISSIVFNNKIFEIGENAFYNCTSLTHVTWPETVTEIKSLTFTDCTGLQSIFLPNTVTKIGSIAFGHCNNLKTIDLPESIIEIGDWAFGETALTEVVIPKGVTKISSCLFKRCYDLKKVVLNENVIIIEEQAFSDCYGLEELWCEAKIPPRCENDWIFFDVDKSKCALYVPESSVDYYKVAYGWNWINVQSIESGIGETQIQNKQITPEVFNIRGQRIQLDSTEKFNSGILISKGRKFII